MRSAIIVFSLERRRIRLLLIGGQELVGVPEYDPAPETGDIFLLRDKAEVFWQVRLDHVSAAAEDDGDV